ncbi:MAG: hypothetical protein HY015_06760 [Bacteroidetes bacterium]|nr:hypothetical protein [Bacteroidota bacterium]MBI3482665.1 hypothetical protein [Bacteroidota bacterium]
MKRTGLFLLLIIPYLASAQSFFAIRQERRLILTAGTGTATYFGELSNPGTILNFQPNLNVGLQMYLSPIVSVRSELNWFVLHGDDKLASEASRKARGLSFRSNCFEISGIGEVSLFANGNRYYRRPTINFYGFGGIGLLYFNPVDDYNGKAYSLEPLQTEGVSYSRVTPVIPFGLGLRLKVSPNLNLAIEGGYRKTFTDYLDDVSTRYADPNSFSDPIAKYFANPNSLAYNPSATGNLNNYTTGSKRGNSNLKDSYFLLNAKIEYYLPFTAKSGRRGNGLLNRSRHKSSTYRYNKRGGVKRR